jgi:transposase-like protein
MVLQRDGELPKIPKDLVKPTIVAGINALGRGQDRESLTTFITTIAQTMGPQALAQYINPDEAIKRLAAAQGIDILNLVKSVDQLQQDKQQQQQQAVSQSLVDQAGQLASTPMMDPTKNPQAMEMITGGSTQANPTAQEQAPPGQ